eukprot:c4507_g1_i1.p1 GENE.c4507_g1_i1~~c4507_g1_i1.p1  ORF type:complete len:111 (-),score=14.48 c4507_g1_i1:57-389(-)
MPMPTPVEHMTSLLWFAAMSQGFAEQRVHWCCACSPTCRSFRWGYNLFSLIPSKLGLLTNLRDLRLSGLVNARSIPTQLGNLEQLTSFEIKQSHFRNMFPLDRMHQLNWM